MAAPALAAPADEAAKKRPRAGQGQLRAFASCAPLVRYGRRHADEGRGATPPRFFPQPPTVFVPPAQGGPEGGGTTGARRRTRPQPTQGFARDDSETSPTNVQEAGVDEPDLVKTRGSTIFAVAAGRLHAVEAGASPALLGSLEVPGFGHELLLSGDRLLVLSHDYAEAPGGRQAHERRPAHRPARGDPHRGRREPPAGHAHPALPARRRHLLERAAHR